MTKEGLKQNEKKIESIQNFSTPKNQKDLQRSIGMITYINRYIPKLSTQLSMLRQLTDNNVEWRWTIKEDQEFQITKSLVSDLNMLKYYKPKEPLIKECDSSCFGLGVAVYHKDGIIGYAARTLTKTEQIEKELLSIAY